MAIIFNIEGIHSSIKVIHEYKYEPAVMTCQDELSNYYLLVDLNGSFDKWGLVYIGKKEYFDLLLSNEQLNKSLLKNKPTWSVDFNKNESDFKLVRDTLDSDFIFNYIASIDLFN